MQFEVRRGPMPIHTEILPSFYQDSVGLMRIASQVRTRPGVRKAAAFMAPRPITPSWSRSAWPRRIAGRPMPTT